MVIVVFGPGGVGKGALARALLERDGRLWLSRSWTTRERRSNEPSDAYVFVNREAFIAAMEQGLFLETNEFSGNREFYGTPWPEPPSDDLDVLLEIDLNGARQVKQQVPGTIAILVVPPSNDELERRLRGRGDDEEHVRRRLELADYEVTAGREIADYVVVNDDLDRATDEVGRILASRREHPPAGSHLGTQ